MPSIRDKPPFSQVPHALLVGGLSAGAVKTYAVIRMRAWDYGSEYLSGVEWLAEQVGVSRQSVSAYLDELEAFGAIERRRRPRGRANVPLAVTHPSSYDPDALSRFQKGSGQARATTAAGLVVNSSDAVVKTDDKLSVKITRHKPSRGHDGSIEEDSFKKQEQQARSHLLEEEEARGEREWYLMTTGADVELDIPEHLMTSVHAESLLRTAETAIASALIHHRRPAG